MSLSPNPMEPQPQTTSLPVPSSRRGRFLYLVVTIVLPIVCFIVSPVLRPEWQNGETSAYATLLLDPNAALFFFPFLIYSMACMGLLLIAPARYAPRFPVRFGIYTGVFLALQYAILVIFALTAPALLADGIFFGLWLLGWGVKTKFGQRGLQVLSSLVCLVGVIWFGLTVLEQFRWGPGSFESLRQSMWSTLSSLPVLILATMFLLAPGFCLIAMSFTALKLMKTDETSRLPGLTYSLGWLAWLGGMAAAWRFSILKMFEIYASLPPQPPNCYIATAAARGHPLLVRSQPMTLETGPLRVNPQLQTLKCAELALLALAPGLHHRLRSMYDFAGPPLAKRLTNPWLADLAYLTLKPAEWLARGVLKSLVPEIDRYARKLYKK